MPTQLNTGAPRPCINRCQRALLALFVGAVMYASAASAAPLPAQSLARITASSAEPSFVERHHLLHELGDDALADAAEELFRFLETVKTPPGMERNDFLSLKNDTADRLIAADVRPAEHLRLALKTVRDDTADFVWRDYCVQKFPGLMATGGARGEDREAAAAELGRLARGRVPGMTGTALVALVRLAEGPTAAHAPPISKIAELAMRNASDPGAPLIDRVTALQIAAETDASGVAEYAASLLQESEATPVMLRVSAIAALGEAEDPRYLVLIKRHRRSPDIRLRAASRSAAERLGEAE